MLIIILWRVCMKYFWATFLLMFIVCVKAQAQYSSQKDAVYMATLKAVVDYKINDEENLTDIEYLRNDQYFLKELTRMLDKLSNSRSKNSVNNRIYNILLKAGREVYDELR